MIKSITAINPSGEALTLELGSPEKSGFQVLSIDGLGPNKADINLSEMATMDGAYFTSARVSTRNIVINMQPMAQPTVETKRLETFKYFQPKKIVGLIIETEHRICQTYGYVESNEHNIFSDQTSVQISILCPDPYLYSIYPQILKFSYVDPNFEFPFSNESLSDPLLEVGIINKTTERTLVYDGDVDTGMIMTIHNDGKATPYTAITTLSLYNIFTGDSMTLDISKINTMTGRPFGSLGSVEDIVISSLKGKKTITLLRDGVTINILNIMTKDSNWLTLSKGINRLAYYVDSNDSDLTFTIESQIAYMGV